MAPLAKRKYAKSRQRERRGHQAATIANSFSCPKCHNEMLSHHVCATCGYYHGREVIKIKTESNKKTT